jgi:hypothetical protein
MLKDEMIAYTDKYGLIQPQKQPNESGNGLLYTSEYIVTLAKLGQLETDDKVKYLGAIMSSEVQPGLFKRNPEAFTNDIEAIDDYIGLAAGSKAANRLIAQRILKYGREHKFLLKDIISDYLNRSDSSFHLPLIFVSKLFGNIKVGYVYNNLEPNKANSEVWFGRFPQLIASLKWAAGEEPTLFEKVYTALVIATSGNKNDTNTFILSDLVVYCSQGSWLCRQVAKIWKWRLYKMYPNGMKDVYKQYFGADYPLSNYIE